MFFFFTLDVKGITLLGKVWYGLSCSFQSLSTLSNSSSSSLLSCFESNLEGTVLYFDVLFEASISKLVLCSYPKPFPTGQALSGPDELSVAKSSSLSDSSADMFIFYLTTRK